MCIFICILYKKNVRFHPSITGFVNIFTTCFMAIEICGKSQYKLSYYYSSEINLSYNSLLFHIFALNIFTSNGRMKTTQVSIQILQYMFLLLNIEIIKLSNINELCQSLLWG